jgi:uncharacterized protein YjiS (DUF1127 family)
MNAPLSKEQLAQFMDPNLAYRGQYVPGLSVPIATPAREGSFSRWLRALGGRISGYLERRAVLAELAQLSDRDLSDIGLSREHLHRVFDPEFARSIRKDA